jgi:hypothetical protein
VSDVIKLFQSKDCEKQIEMPHFVAKGEEKKEKRESLFFFYLKS